MYGSSTFLQGISKHLLKDHLVVHHMSEGDNVRVRVISEFSPWEGAVNASPNLEDAYLWLLKKKRLFRSNNDKNQKMKTK